MKHYFGKSFDHIDPLYRRDTESKTHRFSLVCGLHCLVNIAEIPKKVNTRKSDAFVPYRVKNLPAPVHPGDIGEFWISGRWRVTPFLGDHWWYEAKELGYSKSGCSIRIPTDGSSTRGTVYYTNGRNNLRLKPGDPVPPGYYTGRTYSNKA